MSWQGNMCDFFLEEQPSDSTQTHQGDETNTSNFNLSHEANRHRTSISSSSGSSAWGPESPAVPTSRRPSTSLCPKPDPDEEAEDAPWNLVTYHIPWGPGYEGYEAGTLPGPDGACIFLRSPTPLKRQRTSQACDKCRERKAKCSGARPTCGRCSERGFLCVYSTSQTPSVAGETPGSPIKVHRKLSYSNLRDQLKTSAIKNRIRRKSSQTETTVSTSLSNRPHHAFPRRHSQPASTAYSLTTHSVMPIVSFLQEQLYVEEEQARNSNASTQTAELMAPQDLNVVQQSHSLYAQSITALDAYRFPLPSIQDAPMPSVICPPDMDLTSPYADHGRLSIQSMPSIPPESLWRVSEYFPQLGLERHDAGFDIEPFELSHYTCMPTQQHISAAAGNFLDQEQQMAYHSYFHGYKSNLEP